MYVCTLMKKCDPDDRTMLENGRTSNGSEGTQKLVRQHVLCRKSDVVKTRTEIRSSR